MLHDLIASGPTMMVLVGLSYDTFPDPNLDTMTPPLYALIDTGASQTCVDKTLAIQLELPIRGKPFSLRLFTCLSKSIDRSL